MRGRITDKIVLDESNYSHDCYPCTKCGVVHHSGKTITKICDHEKCGGLCEIAHVYYWNQYQIVVMEKIR